MPWREKFCWTCSKKKTKKQLIMKMKMLTMSLKMKQMRLLYKIFRSYLPNTIYWTSKSYLLVFLQNFVASHYCSHENLFLLTKLQEFGVANYILNFLHDTPKKKMCTSYISKIKIGTFFLKWRLRLSP